MAVATDLGVQDERYPPDKLNVGRRLALLARHRVYGEKLLDVGPTYRGMKVEGNKVRVNFDLDSVGGGLTLGISPSQEGGSVFSLSTGLRGFAVAGSDHKWFAAQGGIDGSSVQVSSDAVLHPVAVRYNWRGFPVGNLYNKEGLPAPPFRSDCDQPN
jgi:sialate O-acetylesterase